MDTSAFYAVLDADDDMHRSAWDVWADLLTRKVHFVTTNYVLLEITALLQSRMGLDAVRAFSSDILPILSIVWIDEAAHRSAYHALLVSGSRRLSLVDCVSFEVMRRLDLDTAFCFDPHFSIQGFSVVPESKKIEAP